MRKILIIGGACIVLLAVVFGLTALQNKRQETGSICRNMVDLLVAENTTGSYALFSDSAKRGTAENDWKAEVSQLRLAYGKNPSVKEFTQKEDPASGTVSQEILLEGNYGDYSVSCYLSSDGKSLDGFESRGANQ